MRMALAVLALVIASAISQANAACAPLPAYPVSGANYTSICVNVLSYNSVYLTTDTCAVTQDQAMNIVVNYAAALSSACADALLRYTCGYFNRPCSVPLGPPQAICNRLNISNAATSCTALDSQILQTLQGSFTSAGVSFTYTGCDTTGHSITSYKTPANPPYFSSQELSLPSCSASYSGNSICQGLVNYPIYLSTSNVAQISQSEALVNGFAFLLNTVPMGCVNSYYRLLCYTAFPRCFNALTANPSAAPLVAAGLIVPVASLPTQSLCQSVMSTCGNNPSGVPWVASWFQPLNLTPSFCSSTSVISRNCAGALPNATSFAPRFYPVSGYSSSSGVVIPAIDPYGNASSLNAPINCPWPLVVPDNPSITATIGGGSCAVPCISILNRPGEFNQLSNSSIIVSIISVVFFGFQFLTYAVFREARQQHKLILFTVFSLFIFLSNHWGWLSPAPGGGGLSFGCLDNVNVRTDVQCTFSGWLLVFSFAASLGVWLSFAKDVCVATSLSLKLWTQQHPKRMRLFDALLVLLLPLGLSLGLLAAGQLGAQPTVSYPSGGCSVSNTTVFIYAVIAPILVYLLIGAASLSLSIRKLYKVTSATKTKSHKQDYRTLIMPSMLLVLFVVLYGFQMSALIYEWNETAQFTADSTTYITCLLATQPASVVANTFNASSPIVQCNVYPNRNYILTAGIMVVGDGLGLWVFIIFMFSRKNRQVWVRAFQRISNRVTPLDMSVLDSTAGTYTHGSNISHHHAVTDIDKSKPKSPGGKGPSGKYFAGLDSKRPSLSIVQPQTPSSADRSAMKV